MEVFGITKYEKLKQIGVGQGKNSEVYLSKDVHTGSEIVVKEIPKSLIRQSGLTDYFAEAKVMFPAGDNPQNVVPILYACDVSNVDAIGLVMPFYKNGSLADRIQQSPLGLCESIRVSLGVLHGVSAIHKKGFGHFDIKPSNVLFANNGDPMVADFGQSRAVNHAGVASMPPMYPAMFPPEVFSGNVVSTLSDIYHIGLTIYRMVNGDPFWKSQIPADDDDRDQMIQEEKLPDRTAFLPHVPKQLRTIIRIALRKNPQDRYESPSKLVAALRKVTLQRDWQTQVKPDGEIEWKCRAPRKSDRKVMLRKHGSKWAVEAYMGNGSRQRAFGKSGTAVIWKDSLTRKDAMKHLKSSFESMT
jgi:serine/threonine protein kinase